MAYCALADLQSYAGIPAGTDEALLTSLIAPAQAWIDDYCGRTFEASQDSTRTFSVTDNTQSGGELYFDADCAQITTVKNNADNGTSGVTVTDTQYVPMPRNAAPMFGIRLLASSGIAWAYTNDPDNAITVTGRWAYSVTAPAEIKQACVRLATYMYRQKDASTFDTTAIPDAGVILVPQGMPKDVQVILNPYRRRL